jgi:eukaryotic-like serine/threonine-protein kinase
MAEVQLALQRGPAGFEKLVVVKLVHNSLASQKAFVDMLLDEARVAALVKHPNVVDIYDLGQAEGRYFIAMEYLEGEPLLAVLRAGREGKRLDCLSTGRLIADTAEGLDAAHELRSMAGDRLELVHHDISLGNIVVLYNGQVKLVDFGVAKATQTAGQKSKVQGKFSYMAPEKLKGAPGDRRSDIFSLGCVMWEALTLKRLFRGGNDAETMKQVLEMAIQPPSKINGDVPPEYDPIVMRALERNPDRRQGTAKEMAVEIEELLRKRGYGAKNDKIARYMQDTFKSHIDARKKLVQEVVNKGSASAEVLDAAFSDPILASGSPITPVNGGEFSVKYNRVTPANSSGVPIPTAAWADSSPRTTISPPPVHPMFDGGGNTATEIRPLRSMRDTDGPEIEITHHGVSIVERARLIASRLRKQAEVIWADKQQRFYALAAIGGLLLIIIIAIALRGGDDAKPVAAAEPVVAEQPGTKAAVDTGSAKVPDEGPEDIVIETGGDTGPGPTDKTPPIDKTEKAPLIEKTERTQPIEKTEKVEHHPKIEKVERTPKVEHTPKVEKTEKVEKIAVPQIDVVDTVNKGLKAFVTGDAQGALVLLKQAKAAKPGYAPTYRVLGKVYKKLGDNGSAKAAYQRYLKLAPNAPDAEQIRTELAAL